MRRTTTILLVGALVAALALGVLSPAASAHSGTHQQASNPDTDTHSTDQQPWNSYTDTHSTDQQPSNSYTDTHTTTEALAQDITHWMAERMGPEGVAAFAAETGTTIEAVVHAMAKRMGPWVTGWDATAERGQYGPGGFGSGGSGPGGYGSSGYGSGIPCGGGHGMGGAGHGMGGGW